MKIVRVVLSVLVILIVIATIGIVVFLQKFDLDKYRPQITDQATKALGRSVSIDKLALTLGWTKGIVLNVNGVAVADSAQFSADPLLVIKVIHLRLDVVALITQRKIVVTSADIVSPIVRCVRDAQGVINFQQLASASQNISSSSQDSTQKAEGNQTGAKAQLPALLVQRVSIKDAEIFYLDKMFSPAIQLNAHHVNVDFNNVSLEKPFLFDVSASLWNQKENITAHGWIKVDVAKASASIDQLKIETSLQNIDWLSVVQSLPMLNPVPLDPNWAGNIKVLIASLKASAKGLESLNFEGRLDNGKIRIKNIEYPFENIDIQVEGTEKDIVLKQAFVFVAGGQIDAKGTITDYLTTRGLNVSGNLQNIALSDLVAPYHLPIQVSGKIQGKFSLSGDVSDPNKALDTLKGFSTVEIKDGKIVDFNLLRVVLDKISVIPDLAQRIEDALPENLKERLNRKDTILTDAHAEIELAQKMIQLVNVGFGADDFVVTLKGKVGFDLISDLKTEFFIKDELASVLVDKIPEFGYLLDDQKRIYFPLAQYQGDVTKYRPMPDLEYLAKRVVVNKGKEELKNVIFKALDIDKQETQSEDPNAEQKPADPKKELINNVLDSIFK